MRYKTTFNKLEGALTFYWLCFVKKLKVEYPEPEDFIMWEYPQLEGVWTVYVEDEDEGN